MSLVRSAWWPCLHNAGVAENSNPKRCVQVTLTSGRPSGSVWWVDTYSEGPCR